MEQTTKTEQQPNKALEGAIVSGAPSSTTELISVSPLPPQPPKELSFVGALTSAPGISILILLTGAYRLGKWWGEEQHKKEVKRHVFWACQAFMWGIMIFSIPTVIQVIQALSK